MPDPDLPEPLPAVDTLQFRRAQPIVPAPPPASQNCAACKQLITGEYYQVQNHVICSQCAAKIQAGRQAAQTVSLFRPVVYGAGAALAGCLLYAVVLAMGVQIGIIALAVGYMVGKAIRYASYGLGGRPQQILAVALTYFAISTSFLPASFFVRMKQAVEAKSAPRRASPPAAPPIQAIAGVLILAAISPFLELRVSPVGGLISLFILFIGLQRAWVLTARQEILVTGPYT
jgi:hypothetical protein